MKGPSLPVMCFGPFRDVERHPLFGRFRRVKRTSAMPGGFTDAGGRRPAPLGLVTPATGSRRRRQRSPGVWGKALPTLEPKLRLRLMARPSSYSPVVLPVVRACATFCATAEEIANYLNIPWGSFKRWIYAEPELREALKRGRDASDERVVESLYRKAING